MQLVAMSWLHLAMGNGQIIEISQRMFCMVMYNFTQSENQLQILMNVCVTVSPALILCY